MTKFCILTLFAAILSFSSFSQYILNGSATKNNCNCYTLTTEKINQSGSVWNSNKIDLSNSFDFHFNVYLGCKDLSGADGIVFILQPISTSVGTTGEGMGFEGVSPSVGISLDTWQNFTRNDPWYDHISIQLNGQVTHGNDLAGPIPASATSDNIEDCNWHVFRIIWDATTKTAVNPPAHIYSSPGAYIVKHVITGMDGCVSDTMKKTVYLGAKPVADFSLYDTCSDKLIGIKNVSHSSFGDISHWDWTLDGSIPSAAQQPSFSDLSLGNHQLKLAVSTIYGCSSDTVTKNFSVMPTPVVKIQAENGCLKLPIHFSGQQIDNATNIIQWNWKFGDGQSSSQKDPEHTYATGGMKTVHLTGIADNGCASNDTNTQIRVESIFTNAGKDTSVQADKPFSLNGTWGGDLDGTPVLKWSPSTGLSTTSDPSPIAVLQNDQTYSLTAVTDIGCTATDVVRIKVFTFPGVLVPTAFTPNHDGLNEILLPRYNGIKPLEYFVIYNRWGQLVFKTTEMDKGWDGRFDGKDQSTGVFVWVISAEGFDGRKYQLRGTTAIIK